MRKSCWTLAILAVLGGLGLAMTAEARPAAQAKKDLKSLIEERQKAAQKALEVAAKVKAERERRYLEVVKELGDKGEERISEAYIKKLYANKGRYLTKEEKAILKALDSTMAPNFDKTGFKDVIEYLHDKTKAPIILNENSLKEAMVEYDDQVTFKLKTKVAVRTILRKVLNERGLTYIIKGGAIQVVTIQEARTTLEKRIYPISDLVDPGLANPYLRPAVMQQTAQFLILLIQNTVDPEIWNSGQPEGPSITYSPNPPTLIVRAPAELHMQYGNIGQKK